MLAVDATHIEVDSTLTVKIKDPEALARLLREASPYRAVAEAIGATFGYVGHLAMGKRDRVGLQTALRLAHALDVPVTDLFEVTEADVLRETSLV